MSAKIEIDWGVLDALLQFKVPIKFVADYMGVSVNTIQRNIESTKGMTFSEYHELKLNRTGFKLQQKAIEMALSGNTTMMIFALKNLANWSDKLETRMDTTAIQINIDQSDNEL